MIRKVNRNTLLKAIDIAANSSDICSKINKGVLFNKENGWYYSTKGGIGNSLKVVDETTSTVSYINLSKEVDRKTAIRMLG